MGEQQAISGVPRVLIVSASVGAGHNSAARAIAESLRSAEPSADVSVLDVLSLAPLGFRAYYAGGFSLAVSRLPWAYGLGYWLTDRPDGPARNLRERRRLWTERLFLKAYADHVLGARPDVIVHTHFLTPPVTVGLLRLATPQMVVVTDIRMHRFWYCEEVSHWFAPADETAERLRRWGIAPERITVSGIPIHPKWTAPLDRERILAEWRLPADRPIVLLSGGVEFTCGPVVRIARQILARCERAFVCVLAGRNKRLLARLARLPEAPQRLMPVGFTDRLHELVEVAALMVTKAGGLSTAECLAKATPMVLLRPVPGQESGNAEHFERFGAAVIARRNRDAAGHVARLLADDEALRHMSDSARRLYRPATETIVAAIRAAVGRP